MTLGILGGGLAGLSLAYFLGSDCEVLERDAVCGGAAAEEDTRGNRHGAADIPKTEKGYEGDTFARGPSRLAG